MNARKKSPEKPFFEIDPETGKRILLPLNLEEFRKVAGSDSSSQRNLPQRVSSSYNYSRKPILKETQGFDNKLKTDSETNRRFLRPLNLEEFRRCDNSDRSPRRTFAKKSTTNSSNYGPKNMTIKETRNTEKLSEIDPETSRRVLRPINLDEFQRRSPKRTISQRITTNLSNIGTKNTLFKEEKMSGTEERPSKLRKIEEIPHSIRKGLFSPAKPANSVALKRNSIQGKNFITKRANRQTIIGPKSSPLLNMEEVEEEFLNKKRVLQGYHFKSPSRYEPNFTHLMGSRSKSKKLEVPQVIIEEHEMDISKNIKSDYEPRTPGSTDSSNEFKKLEAMCSKKINSANFESPTTTLSNLLQDTVINSIRRTKLNFTANLDPINYVKELEQTIKDEQTSYEQMIKADQTRYELMKKRKQTLFEQMVQDDQNYYEQILKDKKDRYDQTLLRLNGLLMTSKKLVEVDAQTMEISPIKSSRRSIRLQNKSPENDLIKSNKLLTSPAPLRSHGDLRKSTLKKNWAIRNPSFESPSTKISQNCVVETPKTERNILIETPNTLGSRLISLKVQDQWTLLQDTPVAK